MAEGLLGDRHGPGRGGVDHHRFGRGHGAAILYRDYCRTGFAADPAVALGCTAHRPADGSRTGSLMMNSSGIAMMSHTDTDTASALRPAARVMDLERLGSHFQSRLSFVRSSMRRMMNEQWRIQRTCFDLDAEGFGTAIYRIDTASAHYHCVIFSMYLPPE